MKKVTIGEILLSGNYEMIYEPKPDGIQLSLERQNSDIL
jgi:hypothetical protein